MQQIKADHRTFITPGLTLLMPLLYMLLLLLCFSASGRAAPLSAHTIAPVQTPAIPTGLTATVVRETSITLTWQPGSEVAPHAYRLYRRVRVNPLHEYWLPIRSAITQTTATVDGLTPGTQYRFAISALSATAEESGKSAVAEIWTHQAPLAYHPGGGPAVAVVGVRFLYQVAAIGVPAPTFTLRSGPTAMTVDANTGLVEWTPNADDVGEVLVTVRATNAVGTDDHQVLITVQGTPADTTAPGPTLHVTATAVTAHGCTLTWEAAADDVGVVGYRVLAQKNEHGAQLFVAGDTTDDRTTLTINTLAPATEYRLWVAAYDAAGNVASISGLPATTVETLPGNTETPISGLTLAHDGPQQVGVPTYFTATVAGGDQVEFRWHFDASGTSVVGAVVSHTYAISGTHVVTVTASNRQGSATVTDTVLAVTVPHANVNQLSVMPPSPTPTDRLTVTVKGLYGSSCVPEYASHMRNGTLITLHSRSSAELFCLPVETAWGYLVTVDPLPAATYTVVHLLDEQIVDSLIVTVSAPLTPSVPVILTDRGEGQTLQITATQSFTYQVVAVGDGPLTYTLTDAPTGMTIQATTGEINWTPSAEVGGEVTFTVMVSNAAGSDEFTYQLRVQPAALPQQRVLLPLVQR